jgi:cobalt-zinc-cadmium efflux system membrane fusion protein
VSSRDGRLKPEMLATVLAEGESGLTTTVLPEDAIQFLDGKTVVFVAHPDGTGGAQFTPREVEVGSPSGGRVAVTKGLSVGDVVVTRGALAVKAQLLKGAMPEMEM